MNNHEDPSEVAVEEASVAEDEISADGTGIEEAAASDKGDIKQPEPGFSLPIFIFFITTFLD
jgi:hypothetical protein